MYINITSLNRETEWREYMTTKKQNIAVIAVFRKQINISGTGAAAHTVDLQIPGTAHDIFDRTGGIIGPPDHRSLRIGVSARTN